MVFIVKLNGDDSAASEAQARKGVPALELHPHLFDDIRLLAQNAGLAELPLIVVQSQKKDGLYVKKREKNNFIVIDKFYLENFSRQELRGAMAHELAHITLGHLKLFATLVKPQKKEIDADRKGALIAGEVDGSIKALSKLKQLMEPLPLGRLMNVYMDRITDRRIRYLEKFAVRHAYELQESKTKLDALQEKMEKDFTRAATSSAKPASSQATNNAACQPVSSCIRL